MNRKTLQRVVPAVVSLGILYWILRDIDPKTILDALTWRVGIVMVPSLLFYGAVFGALNLAQSVGTATGPLFAGLMHDATGSYVGAFTTAAVLLAIAIPAILFAKKPQAPRGA